jgi:CysZ protein
MQLLVQGAQDLLDGFRLIRESKLRIYVIIPLLINLLVFILLVGGLGGYFSGWVDSLMVILLIAYAFVFVATLIGAPFYGLLAVAVEKHLTGQDVVEQTSWGQVLTSVPHSVARELAKLWYYLPRALALFVICLIPLISPVAPFIWALFSGWTMALEFIDYPADNHKQSITELKLFMRRNRSRTMGFGLLSWLCTLVPVLNLISMQASVAGGVKFWLEAEGAMQAGTQAGTTH